ncbi:MAG: hypothetical protein ACR2Q4_14125 [Geminicoccaceae bacterium]
MTTDIRPGFIVEFVGLPGAGKSTIAHALAKRLRAEGELVTEPTREVSMSQGRRWRKAAHALRSFLYNPRSGIQGIRLILMSRQRTLRDAAVAAFNFLYVRGVMEASACRPGIHLLDQGFCNALWTIGFSAQVDDPLTPFRDATDCLWGKLPDLVLLVTARPATVVARLRARPGVGSRLEQRLARKDFDSQLAAATTALEQTRSVLRQLAADNQTCFQFHIVDNDTVSVETLVDANARLIRRILARQDMQNLSMTLTDHKICNSDSRSHETEQA